MGTRADFYVGRGESAEWLGSIAWDGYPDGAAAERVCSATSETNFRERVEHLMEREDATLPEHGWPWPWENSRTTDFAYAFDEDRVWISNYGRRWFAAGERPDGEDGYCVGEKVAVFPDMSRRQNVTLGPRSGMLVLTTKLPEGR